MIVRIAGDVGENEATFLGEVTQLINVDEIDVLFEWGKENENFPNTTPVQTLTSETTFDETVTTLTPGTTYRFRAVGDTTELTVRSEPVTFTTKTKVVTRNPQTVLERRATLRGELTEQIGGNPNVYFNWGTEGSNLPNNTTPKLFSGPGFFNETITGLSPGETYEFEAVVDSQGFEGRGGIKTFGTKELETKTHSASNVQHRSATLNGEVENFKNFEQEDNTFFKWGEKGKGLTNTKAVNNTPTLPGNFEESISGLSINITYVYKAVTEAGGIRNEGNIFTFKTEPLTVRTGPPESISTDEATLNGNLTNYNSDSDASVYFEWGETGDGFPNATDGESQSHIGSFAKKITELSEETEYEYRAVVNLDSNIRKGNPITFTTSSLDVKTNEVKNIERNEAEVVGELASFSGFGVSDADVFFEWSKDSENFENTKDAGLLSSPDTFSKKITGLSENVTYKIRAVAEASDVREEGAVLNFSTQSLDVQTSSPDNISENEATLNGNLSTFTGYSQDAEIFFEWGKIGNGFPNTTSKQNTSSSTSFDEKLTEISADEEYEFRAVVEVEGDRVVGDRKFFETKLLETATNEASVGSSSSATLEGEITTYKNFESSADVSFEYGLDSGNVSDNTIDAGTQSTTGTFDADLTGLSVGSTYIFRSVATSGGITKKGDIRSLAITSVSVLTIGSANVTSNEATLKGRLDRFEGVSGDATVFFKWGEEGNDLPNQTGDQTLSSTGPFSQNIGSLLENTTYEFQAIAEADGETYTGEVKTFSTPLAVLNFEDVMGQEDKFRQENGERVLKGGTGRVIATTSIPTNLDISYKRNPSVINNPTFGETVQDISLDDDDHEFFFSVAPDTLYAFQLEATATSDSTKTKTSGIYYFETAGELQIDFENQIISFPDLQTKAVAKVENTEISMPSSNYNVGVFGPVSAGPFPELPVLETTPSSQQTLFNQEEDNFGTTFEVIN